MINLKRQLATCVPCILPSCALQSKWSSIFHALLLELTFNIADLPVDSHFPLTPLSRQDALEQQVPHLSPCACACDISLTCSLSLQVTIEELPTKVLLDIFRYYLDAFPRFWTRLVHICRKWRHVVFASQRSLHLRLFCTYGTPVLKYLGCWPSLPIILQYGGTPELDLPTPEDEDNIMAALKQSDRIISVHLTVTRTLLEKLSAINRPVSELEELVLFSRDSPRLTLSNSFGWSARLRVLHLTRIAFFALPQLLYSSRRLVDLQLHEVLTPWHFSPEALIDALSGMTQLQSLSLHVLPTRTDHPGTPLPMFLPLPISLPSSKCATLPALTCLRFQGITEYLEDLVARIDAPYLSDIEITFLYTFQPHFSKLNKFINQIEKHKSPRRADILFSERAISISFLQPGAPTCLKIQLSGELLSESEQLFYIGLVCNDLSVFLSDVEDLRISTTRQSRVEDGLRHRPWPLNSFTGVKWIHVIGNLSAEFVHTLKEDEWRRKTGDVLLPALHKLYIPQLEPRHAPLSEALVSFMTSRALSGHPIAVEYERQCHISELRGAGIIYAKCYDRYSLTRLNRSSSSADND